MTTYAFWPASRNGDILSLKRYGAAGLSENLGYAYNSSGQLYSVRDTVAGSTKTFQFDSAGNLTSDGYESEKEYMYNVLGKLSSVMAPEPGIFSLDRVETAKYIHLADGTKIGVSLPDGSETMYRGPFILHRDADGDVELQTLILPEGIAVPDQNSLKMYIFVSDRLGSIRAVVDLGEREVCEENDYYAFGSRIPGGEQLIENRWRYSGKEEQEALSDLPYIDFGARLYNPRLGRWLSPDPLAEKYHSLSPFNYCGNDPVNKFDPDGREVVVPTVPIWFNNPHLAIEMLSAFASAVSSAVVPAMALIGTAFLCTSDTPLDQTSSVQNSKPYYPPSPDWVRGQQQGEKEKQDKIAVDFQKAVENSGMGNNNNDFKPNNNGKRHSKIETAVLSFLALVNTCTGGGSGQVVATSNGNNQNQQPNQNGNDAQISTSNKDDDCENNNQSSLNAFMNFLIQIFNAQQN